MKVAVARREEIIKQQNEAIRSLEVFNVLLKALPLHIVVFRGFTKYIRDELNSMFLVMSSEKGCGEHDSERDLD